MNSMKLRGHMNLYGDTVLDLAKFLGIHKGTLYEKINGTRQEFTQGEIKRIAERYSLTNNDITEIFFS